MSTTPMQQAQRAAYQQPIDAVLTTLDTDARHGLSAREARARLDRHGKNELTAEKPIPAWRKFLAQFHDVLVILLLIATGISAGLWLFERASALPYEAMAIFAVVLLNAVMGYMQESRAEEAVAALRRMSAAHANVIRDGARQSIPATEVVPGDVMLIEAGDTVPADARLIESTALQTAEASLTGESLPVSKDTRPITAEVGLGDRHNMLFSGTAVTYGRGRTVVTATGMQTQMGRIAGMLHAAPTETTPLQKELDRVGKLLGIIVVVIAVVMIATILLVEDVRGFSAMFDVLIFGVALAVAAVPEGLPAVVTTVLSLGVQRMAKRHAIVRHLAAVETLGSANVIASDKTGTLTKNEMTVRVVVTASGRVSVGGTGYEPTGDVRREDGGAIDGALRVELVRALAAADRANNAVLHERDGRWTVQGDPTEGALIVAARKAGLEEEALDARFARVAEVPFSSERKLMSTIHTDAERQEHLLALTKGAPDVLLARCAQELVGEAIRPLTAERRAAIVQQNEELAGAALRTLGVAFRLLPKAALEQGALDDRVEHDLVFLGLIGMIDPPRAGAKDGSRTRKGCGHSSNDDYRRSSENRCGHCRRTRHRGKRTSGHGCGAGADARGDARPDRARGLGLCARQPRTQAADRAGVAACGRGRGDDGRRRQRCACVEDCRHRRGDGHDRHGRVQRSRRHGTGGRQLRHHCCGGRRGPRDLRKHPQVLALPTVVKHRGSDDHVLWCAAGGRDRAAGGGWERRRAAAAGDAHLVDQPRDGRRARARTRHGSDGRGRHARTAAAAQ